MSAWSPNDTLAPRRSFTGAMAQDPLVRQALRAFRRCWRSRSDAEVRKSAQYACLFAHDLGAGRSRRPSIHFVGDEDDHD